MWITGVINRQGFTAAGHSSTNPTTASKAEKKSDKRRCSKTRLKQAGYSKKRSAAQKYHHAGSLYTVVTGCKCLFAFVLMEKGYICL